MKLPLLLPFLLSLTAPSLAARQPRYITPRTSTSLLTLHKSLCTIPSITYSESLATTWLANYLTAHSFTVEHQPVAENRTNIYAYPGTSRTAKTLLTSHIDTVAPFIPYTLHPNGTITGRGVNDAKGAIASQIIAVQELLAAGALTDGDVSLLFVVGEETGGDGMAAANDMGLSWESVIFGEPTEGKLSRGHKGAMMLRVSAVGRAAHSGYPELGIDANRALVEALYVLGNLELPGSQLLGMSTLNYGRMAGGVAENIVSPGANASVAVRLAVEGERVREVIDGALGGMAVTLEYGNRGYGPQVLDHDVEGFEIEAHSFGTDIPHLRGDHKRYLYGPGSITTAHSDHESVTVAELEEAVEGYKKLILHALGN